jgi:hypothetical protein
LDLASAKLEDTLVQDKPRTVDSSAPSSFRTPSTDLTELEQSLDYWRQQHFRQNYSCMTRGEDEPQSKVRYNDTGSLEEVEMIEQKLEKKLIPLERNPFYDNLFVISSQFCVLYGVRKFRFVLCQMHNTYLDSIFTNGDEFL